METGQDSQDVGKHTLGPHVVGQRVVVRRVLRGETGPTGGPAMTDLLGMCTSWDGGVCVVQPESGPAVAIPLADIVSGKPVPPRPSVRHRVSVRDAERHATVLWPHVERLPLGEWELRSDPAPVGRLLKRANSCLAVGDPGVPYDDADTLVRRFYADRSRDPLVQVETDSGIDQHFSAIGWTEVPGGASYFQLASLAQLSRRLRAEAGTDFASLLDDRPRVSVGVAHDGPRVDVELRDGVELLATARAGVSDDWLGIHALEVDPRFRRKGLATRLVAELVELGAEQGVRTIWLHVETDNQPALALYDGLGFSTHHALRYLTPS